MKFNTSYNPAKSDFEPICPKERQRYKLNKATKKIELQSKEPFYERIQSYAESASLSSVLRRVQLGDNSALSASSGEFIDLSGLPNDLSSLWEIGEKSKQIFNSLPDDYKRLFGNNQAVFSACVANGSAKQIIGMHINRVKPAGDGAKPAGDGAKPAGSKPAGDGAKPAGDGK